MPQNEADTDVVTIGRRESAPTRRTALRPKTAAKTIRPSPRRGHPCEIRQPALARRGSAPPPNDRCYHTRRHELRAGSGRLQLSESRHKGGKRRHKGGSNWNTAAPAPHSPGSERNSLISIRNGSRVVVRDVNKSYAARTECGRR